MKRLIKIGLTVIVLAVVTGCAGLMSSSEMEDGDLVLVVGATGKSGPLLIQELLANGHQVRAMVRNPKKAEGLFDDSVEVVIADLTDKDSLIAAVKEVDGIISAAGAQMKGKGNNSAESIDYQGIKNLVEVSSEAGVKKVVLLSSMGVTQPDHFLNRIANNVLQWKLKGENALRDSGLNYTIIRPGGLSDKPRPEQTFQFFQGDKRKGGSLLRKDSAKLCVAALFSTNTDKKTFEVMTVTGPATPDLEVEFRKLKAD